MTKKKQLLAITFLMALVSLTSCGWNMRNGDTRDKNIGIATLAYLDSIPNIQYVGLTDTHELEDGKFQAVVIYNVIDPDGNKNEYNARVKTNGEGTEILTWEDLETTALSDVKQKVTKKMDEKGISLDGSLIDALIELKKLTR